MSKKKRTDSEQDEVSVAMRHHPFLSKLKVRWVRDLHLKLGLSHGEMLLSLILAELATLPGGVKHCGGRATISKDLVIGFLSKSYWHNIRESLKTLVEKGIIADGAKSSGGMLKVVVTRSFADQVYGKDVISVPDLRLSEYDYSPGTAFANAKPTAKLALMVWRAIAIDKKVISQDYSIVSADDAFSYPRTRIMSAWLGMSEKHFRTLREKYEGVLWTTSPVYVMRNGAVSWTPQDTSDTPYCNVIHCVLRDVLYADRLEQVVNKLGEVASAYDKITRTVIHMGNIGMKPDKSIASMYGDIDVSQHLHDWLKDFIDSNSIAYKRYSKRIEELHAYMESMEPVDINDLVLGRVSISPGSVKCGSQVLYAPVRTTGELEEVVDNVEDTACLNGSSNTIMVAESDVNQDDNCMFQAFGTALKLPGSSSGTRNEESPSVRQARRRKPDNPRTASIIEGYRRITVMLENSYDAVRAAWESCQREEVFKHVPQAMLEVEVLKDGKFVVDTDYVKRIVSAKMDLIYDRATYIKPLEVIRDMLENGTEEECKDAARLIGKIVDAYAKLRPASGTPEQIAGAAAVDVMASSVTFVVPGCDVRLNLPARVPQ